MSRKVDSTVYVVDRQGIRLGMRRIIRKRVRHSQDGLDLAIDLNADLVINVGREHRPAGEREEPADAPERGPDAPAAQEPPDEGKTR